MKNTTWRILTGGALLLSFGLFFTILFTKSNHQPQPIPTTIELPKAERMAAQKAYFQQLYQDPKTNQIPLSNALHKSLLIKKFQDQTRLKTTQIDLNWEEAGPNNVGGRTRAIALDQRDSRIVLTGGVRGGIWKSTNDGVTWRHIPGLIANESIMSSAQDPAEPDHWYAVTGELVGSGANFFGGGIYRSTDNGENWELHQYELDRDENRSVHEYKRIEENNLGGHPIFNCGETCDVNPFIFSTKVIVSPITQSLFVATNGYGIKKSINDLMSFQHSLPEPLDLPEVTIGPLQADSTTTLLLPFESNLMDASGTTVSNFSNINYTDGVHDRGANMEDVSQFVFPKEGIIDGRQGTIEFWFKPDWETFNSGEHDFVLVGNFPDAIFIHHIESQVEIIHTAGDLPGQPWAVAVGNTSHWQKGEWIHLAFTWGGSSIAYYENGQLVQRASVPYILPDNSGTNIQFGRSQGGSFNGTIDELRISKTARDQGEILQSYLAAEVGKRPIADPLQRPLWSDIDIDKNGRLLAYLSGHTAEGAGIYFSDNDGNSWTNLTPDDWDRTMSRGLIRFAPSNPDIAYVLFTGEGTATGEHFYKIDVTQQVLEERSQNLPTFVGFPNPEDDGAPLYISQWPMQLDVKFDDENFVIAGGVNLVRSFDGFSSSTDDLVKHHINSNSHVDNHIVVFDPHNPNAAWLGNDGGIFKTDNILRESPSGQPFRNIEWQHKFKGYNVVTFYALGLPKAADDFRIIAGAQDRGTPVLDRANSLDPQASIGDPFGGDGGFSFLGKNHAYVYAAVGQSYRLKYNENGLPSFESGFLGLTPSIGGRAHDFINPFVVDLEDETAIYYPIANKLLRHTKLDEQPEFSDLQPDDWEEHEGLKGPEGSKITALELSVSPKDILYYAVYQYDQPPFIYKLEDAENATTPSDKNPISGAAPGSWVRCIAVNPDNADEIVAVITSSNVPKLFHSLDGGKSFTNVDGNLANTAELSGPHTNWLDILPFNGTTYYTLATTIGVFSTQRLNGTDTFWELQAEDIIGFASAQMVRSRPVDGLIAVATYGRGVFLGGPGGPPTSSEEPLVKKEAPFKIFPNPSAQGFVQLQFELQKSQKVLFKISDLSGRTVLEQGSQELETGSHLVTLPIASLVDGVYLVHLETHDQRWVQKLLVMNN